MFQGAIREVCEQGHPGPFLLGLLSECVPVCARVPVDTKPSKTQQHTKSTQTTENYQRNHSVNEANWLVCIRIRSVSKKADETVCLCSISLEYM